MGHDVTYSPAFRSIKQPFRLNGGVSEVFQHPSWERAERALLATVAGNGRVLLLSVPGTGKTMLLQSLVYSLRERGVTARLLQDCDDLRGVAAGEVLLIDEVGSWSGAALERVCGLSNPMVLAGLPEMRAGMERRFGVIGSVELERLSAEEVGRFVRARLGACGRRRDAFTGAALGALARHSGGLLRLVVILAGAALFFAELRGSETVGVEDVEEAASMRVGIGVAECGDGVACDEGDDGDGGWRPGRRRVRQAVMAAACVVVLAAAACGVAYVRVNGLGDMDWNSASSPA